MATYRQEVICHSIVDPYISEFTSGASEPPKASLNVVFVFFLAGGTDVAEVTFVFYRD